MADVDVDVEHTFLVNSLSESWGSTTGPGPVDQAGTMKMKREEEEEEEDDDDEVKEGEDQMATLEFPAGFSLLARIGSSRDSDETKTYWLGDPTRGPN